MVFNIYLNIIIYIILIILSQVIITQRYMFTTNIVKQWPGIYHGSTNAHPNNEVRNSLIINFMNNSFTVYNFTQLFLVFNNHSSQLLKQNTESILFFITLEIGVVG